MKHVGLQNLFFKGNDIIKQCDNYKYFEGRGYDSGIHNKINLGQYAISLMNVILWDTTENKENYIKYLQDSSKIV